MPILYGWGNDESYKRLWPKPKTIVELHESLVLPGLSSGVVKNLVFLRVFN